MDFLQRIDWSAFFAFVAIALSQLPPIKFWRRQQLKVEVYSRANISHLIGNPGVGLVVNVRNLGGRSARIRSLKMNIEREGSHVADLHPTHHYESLSSNNALIYVPVELAAGQSWMGSLVFSKELKRAEELEYRRLTTAIRKEIADKIAARPANQFGMVTAEESFYQPFIRMYEREFRWVPGDYKLTISLVIEGTDQIFPAAYRFTLYDFEVDQLAQYTEQYKYGHVETTGPGVSVPLLPL